EGEPVWIRRQIRSTSADGNRGQRVARNYRRTWHSSNCVAGRIEEALKEARNALHWISTSRQDTRLWPRFTGVRVSTAKPLSSRRQLRSYPATIPILLPTSALRMLPREAERMH